MPDLPLLAARVEMHTRSDDGAAFRYLRQEGVSISAINGAFGAYTVANIADVGNARFDFTDDDEEGFRAFLLEAFDADDETVADLVAWPLDRPEHVFTMFGRVGLIGISEAMNPSTYFVGGVLTMHRHPLAWLQSRCRGAAIASSLVSARQLLDLPGRVAAVDLAHGRRLASLMQSTIPTDKILAPARRAA